MSLSRLRMALVCLVAALAALTLLAPARADAYPAGFEDRALVGGLTGTTGVDFAPDGRAFIVEKAGRVKVAAPGAGTASLLLDISGRVNSNHDRGLLGIAVDSSFATNGYCTWSTRSTSIS